MKLHLPSGLRKALLVCLAALAGHRALRRTVASGTALLGAFSVLWSAAPPSQANEESPLIPPVGDELALGLASGTEEFALDALVLADVDDEDEDRNLLTADSEEDVRMLAAENSGIMPIAEETITLDEASYTIAGNQVTPGTGGGDSTTFDPTDTLYFTHPGDVSVSFSGNPDLAGIKVGDSAILTVTGLTSYAHSINVEDRGTLRLGARSGEGTAADTTYNLTLASGYDMTGAGTVEFWGGQLTLNGATYGTGEGTQFTGTLDMHGKLLFDSVANYNFGGTIDMNGNELSVVSSGAVYANFVDLNTFKGKGGGQVVIHGTLTGETQHELTCGQISGASWTTGLHFEGEVTGYHTFNVSNSVNPGDHDPDSIQFQNEVHLSQNATFNPGASRAKIHITSSGSIVGEGADGAGVKITKTGDGQLIIEGAVSGVSMFDVQAGTLDLARGIDASGVVINLDTANGGINTSNGDAEARVTIAGITGSQAANMQGTWTIDTGGETYTFEGTVKRNASGDAAQWGVNLTKKGEGTQKFGAAESIYNLTVEEGIVEIGRWHIGDGAGWANTIVIGGIESDDGGTYKTATLLLSGTEGASRIKNAGSGLSLTVNQGGTLESKSDLSLEGTVSAVSVHGGNLVVEGLFSVAGAATLTVDEGGSATLKGGLTVTAAVNVTGGTLELSGAISAGPLTVSNGTVKAQSSMTVTRGQTWTLEEGGVLEVGDGATLALSEGEGEWTLDIRVSENNAPGGQLKLTQAGLTALSELSGLSLTLAGLEEQDGAWSYQLFKDVNVISVDALTSFVRKVLQGYSARGLSVDEGDLLTYSAQTEAHDLTWRNGTTWQAGGEG